jgi:histidinol-phosphatase (PHP family)
VRYVELDLTETKLTENEYKEFLKMGGKFTLSDDSHGVAQLGLNFGRAVDYLKSLGVETLYYFEREVASVQAGSKPPLLVREMPLVDLNIDAYPHT